LAGRVTLAQCAAPLRPEVRTSAAARSFGTSASVMRPTSQYLKAPPLAHSTTTAIGCFLAVAARRATVRNSLRSWLNPEADPDRLPFFCAGGEAVRFADGLGVPFPAAAIPAPGEEDCVAGFGSYGADLVLATELGSAHSAGGCGFLSAFDSESHTPN